MSLPEFDDLPFNIRPDLSPYLIHLTKNTKTDDEFSALDNLRSILQKGTIWGSSSSGYIKGPNKATCFMDVPFIALKYILNEDNCDPERPRYEPYGIFITKRKAYQRGCRPVLYLSNQELLDLEVPQNEIWRVVRFEVTDEGWISWIHEREWRCKGDFELPSDVGVLVKTSKEAIKLQEQILKKPEKYKIKPQTILPLKVVCQGLNI